MNTWPFKVRVDGNDLCVDNIVITCFGGYGSGISDPQDKGDTASGLNTRTQRITGVSIPMDGKQFSTLGPDEHKALDDCPIPRLLNSSKLTAWHTQVVIYIGGRVYQPKDGIIDLGPGLGASRDGRPHALDCTVFAARAILPAKPLKWYAHNFEVTGSYRIINGAVLGGLVRQRA